MMALRYNLVLTFLAASLLLAPFAAAQYESPDDYDDSPSPKPEPGPSPLPSSQELEADVSPSPQADDVFAPAQSPSLVSPSPVGGQEPIQSPSPSPSEGGEGGDLSNSYVSFPDTPAGPPPPFIGYGSEYSPFSDEEEEALKSGVSLQTRVVCQSTDSPTLCESTMNPYIKGGEDAPALVKLAIEATGKLADEGLALAQRTVDGSWNTPEVASVLNDCRNIYANAVRNFAKAKEAAGDVSTAKTMLSAVITEVGDCEDAYAKSGMESPLASVSDNLTRMTGNCLTIVSQLS